MQTGLHIAGWAGFGLAVIVLVPIFAYALLVTVIVVGQAAAAFGQ